MKVLFFAFLNLETSLVQDTETLYSKEFNWD